MLKKYLGRGLDFYRQILSPKRAPISPQLLLDWTRTKIVLSPHYDDLALSIGGLAKCWQAKQCLVEDWIIFSRGNYLHTDKLHQTDFSIDRMDLVSKLRHQEELAAGSELGISTVKRLGLEEAPFRGHPELISKSQRAYALTMADQETMIILSQALAPLLDQNVDLFVPLGLGGHYDHILVREVVCDLLAKHSGALVATILFYEDLPYANEATLRQHLEMRRLMRPRQLRAISLPIDLEAKLALLRHYPSQIDSSWIPGLSQRAHFHQKQTGLDQPAEQVFLLTKN